MNLFKKVSLEQYLEAIGKTGEEAVKEYEDIKIPSRGTKYSAGYDFYVSGDIVIPMEHAGIIPTGIRWVCDKEEDKNKVLQISDSLHMT